MECQKNSRGSICASHFSVIFHDSSGIPLEFRRNDGKMFSWGLRNVFVEWSCVNKRIKSVGTLNSGWVVVYIALVKIPEREGNISPSSFYWQLLDYELQVFSLVSPVDEFSLNEMRTWDQSKISSYCFCVWCESRKLGSRRSSRLPCVTPVVETFSDRVTFRIPPNINNGELLCENTQWV